MSDRLTAGQSLDNDQALISADGRYAAYLQDDANFVLCYTQNGAPDLSRPYWSVAANAVGNYVFATPPPGPYVATMQANGEFELCGGPSVQAYWASPSIGTRGQYTAIMQTDGNFVVYQGTPSGNPGNPGATPLWSSGTVWVSQQVTSGDRLATNQWMTTDTPLISADGRWAAYLQDDANLVLCYAANGAADLGRPYWSAFSDAASAVGGVRTGPHFAVMQSDGNFVLYNGPDPASHGPDYWATDTNRAQGQFTAIMQTDGNFVVYDASSKPIWASNTWWVSRPVTAAGSDRLVSNQTPAWIGNDRALISEDLRFAAVLRGDGNLILCHTSNSMPDFSQTYWSALSSGDVQVRFPPGGPPYYAIMQSDGNFVVYNGTGPSNQGLPYWATNTPRNQAQFTAIIATDGNFVVYEPDPGDLLIWIATGQYSAMRIVSGNNQSVPCQQYDEFTDPYGVNVNLYAANFQPIQVQFTDRLGKPLPGLQMSWSVSQSNIPSGSTLLLSQAVYGGPSADVSDANGMCSVSPAIAWLLSNQAQQRISFSITATATGDVTTSGAFPAVTFNLSTTGTIAPGQLGQFP